MLSVVVCSIEGRKRLLYGELSLRGAAGRGGENAVLWGSSRCAGLLDQRKEEAAFLGGGGGGPDMRLLDQRKRLLHGDLPLLLRCAELLGWGRKEAAFGGSSRCVGC